MHICIFVRGHLHAQKVSFWFFPEYNVSFVIYVSVILHTIIGHIRVAKCHGYNGYIRVNFLASLGKSLGEHTILQNEAFFWKRFTQPM